MTSKDPSDEDDDGYESPANTDRAPGRRPCPGCGRTREACWIMPCLYLETLLDRSDELDPEHASSSVRAWAKAGGAAVSLRRSG